jgi:hypothetical protein
MLAFAILIVVALYVLSRVPTRIPRGKPWTIYGTMGCGWTRKQLDYMKKAGKPFVFVDCDKNECEGMDAFPTLVSPKGVRHKGYKEV